MALIDYKGFRLIAMPMLPLESGSLIYGSEDAGITVQAADSKLNHLIEVASRRLNLKSHTCGSENTVVYSPVDLEGHRGSDGRYYLLDFSRVFPPITPVRDVVGGHLFQMFRSEFLDSWLVPLSSDAYSRFVDSQPDKKKNNDDVDTATKDLLGITLSNFARELAAALEEEVRIVGTLTQFRLTEELHRKGINMRYLGLLVARLGKFKYAKFIVAHMCARIIKIQIRERLRQGMKELRMPVDEPYRIVVTDYLNLVFGNTAASTDHWNTEIVKELDQRFSLRPKNWRQFPRNLKEWLWTPLEGRKGSFEDLRIYLFEEVRNMTGLSFSSSLEALVSEFQELWSQEKVLDDTDVTDLGAKVKHLDVMSKARGRVFTMRGEEKHSLGYLPSARQLFCSALQAYETALSGSPLDPDLLCSCASTLLQIEQIDHLLKGGTADTLTLHRMSPIGMRVKRYYVRAIQSNHLDAFSHLSYAKFLVLTKQFDVAEEHFLQALTLEPNMERGLLAYSEYLMSSTNHESSEAQLFRARALMVRQAAEKAGLK